MSQTDQNPKIPCNTNNVGYKLSCETCENRGIDMGYEGETGRSARIRGMEHRTAFLKNKPDNVFYKHKQLEHMNENMKIKMEITRPYKDYQDRQTKLSEFAIEAKINIKKFLIQKANSTTHRFQG